MAAATPDAESILDVERTASSTSRVRHTCELHQLCMVARSRHTPPSTCATGITCCRTMSSSSPARSAPTGSSVGAAVAVAGTENMKKLDMPMLDGKAPETARERRRRQDEREEQRA